MPDTAQHMCRLGNDMMSPGAPIYLDNNASTAPDPLVVEAVANALRELVANPSSQHAAGQAAAAQIEIAREQLAALVGCRSREVVFTSGATEANNLALQGVWLGTRTTTPNRTRIVIGATEHPAVHEAATELERLGAELVVVPVNSSGLLDLARLAAAVDNRTLLVSVMAANNETGVISDLAEVVPIAHGHGAWVHSDATQAVGRIPLSFSALDLDLLSMSAHKMHGPKGVGALVCSRQVPLAGVTIGGGQEHGLRSGTLNTPGIIGLGVAAKLAHSRIEERAQIEKLRDWFVGQLTQLIPAVEENGRSTARLPNTANLRFVGADAEAILAGMPQLACSTGSACASAVPTPSPVLRAMGLSNTAAAECLRFSLSRTTTENELRSAVAIISAAVQHVRTTLGVLAA